MVLMADNEDARYAGLVERLSSTYPNLSTDTVTEVVDDMRDAFANSRIREYVPLFVERRARTALTELVV
jgi:hypothetical protein